MIFNMKISKSILILSLAILQPFSGMAADAPETPSAVGEAARAVVDRVFGVEGEAENIDYHIVEFSKVSPLSSAVRSALIPGWGQRFNKQPVKGTVLFLSFAASTFGAFHLNAKSKHSYDDYKARGAKDDPLFDDYEDQKSQATLLAVGAGLLWAFSVFDAYRNAYNPLYTRDTNVELAYAPNETTFRVSRKFQ